MPVIPFPFGGDTGDDNGKYSTQLARLLPPGVVWDLEADSEIRATLAATADELERVRVRGRNLIDETDPRTASETIGDWERVLGLPDGSASTIEERRLAVTQKFIAQGGQNYAYFDALCTAAGWPLLSITKNAVLRVGARVGSRVFGAGWAYSMTLNVGTPTADAIPKADFEAAIRKVTHAHIIDLFTYA